MEVDNGPRGLSESSSEGELTDSDEDDTNATMKQLSFSLLNPPGACKPIDAVSLSSSSSDSDDDFVEVPVAKKVVEKDVLFKLAESPKKVGKKLADSPKKIELAKSPKKNEKTRRRSSFEEEEFGSSFVPKKSSSPKKKKETQRATHDLKPFHLPSDLGLEEVSDGEIVSPISSPLHDSPEETEIRSVRYRMSPPPPKKVVCPAVEELCNEDEKETSRKKRKKSRRQSASSDHEEETKREKRHKKSTPEKQKAEKESLPNGVAEKPRRKISFGENAGKEKDKAKEQEKQCPVDKEETVMGPPPLPGTSNNVNGVVTNGEIAPDG